MSATLEETGIDLVLEKLSDPYVGSVIEIASQPFSGMKDRRLGYKWVSGIYGNSARHQYYIALAGAKVASYILWTEHGGLRPLATIELEQFATTKELRSKGIGRQLAVWSLREFEERILKTGREVGEAFVTTSSENRAREFYEWLFLNHGYVSACEPQVMKRYGRDELLLTFLKQR